MIVNVNNRNELHLSSNPLTSCRHVCVLSSTDCTQTLVGFRSDCIITASNVTDDDTGYYNVSLATSTETITFTFGIWVEGEQIYVLNVKGSEVPNAPRSNNTMVWLVGVLNHQGPCQG